MLYAHDCGVLKTTRRLGGNTKENSFQKAPPPLKQNLLVTLRVLGEPMLATNAGYWMKV